MLWGKVDAGETWTRGDVLSCGTLHIGAKGIVDAVGNRACWPASALTIITTVANYDNRLIDWPGMFVKFGWL